MRSVYWPYLESIRCRSTVLFWQWKTLHVPYCNIRIAPLHRQLYTTPLARPLDTSNTVVASEKSLSWRHIHDHSPASFGISDYWGFLPMIPQRTPLPTKKRITVFDTVPNADFDDFKIRFRHSAREVPVDLIVARLENLWRAERGKTKMKVTMEMDKSLVGIFSAEDVITKSHVLAEFDGSVTWQQRKSVDIVAKSSE